MTVLFSPPSALLTNEGHTVNNRIKNMQRVIFFSTSLCLLWYFLSPPPAWAQAVLENPQPASVQSGAGVISGWACEAQRVDIVIDDTLLLPAGYGTSRADTAGVCGDSDNGFGLLFNWNLLGDGAHTLRALVDDVEIGAVAFRVATFGEEFLQGAGNRYQLSGFPGPDDTLELIWQESLQNFEIAQGNAVSGGNTGTMERRLENPQPGSFHSGVGVVSGFVCDADRIDIEINGSLFQASYGTSRADTAGVCGDSDNGFGLLFNWNLLGDGVHTVRALADGVAFATATFKVKTFGEEFLQGQQATFVLPGFPQAGTNARVRWQQSLQNFSLEGTIQEGITQSECGAKNGLLMDAAGQTADAQVTNACSRTGDSLEMLLFPFFPASLEETNPATQPQETGFFACDTLLSIEQDGIVYNAGTDFVWLDGNGEPVCQMLTTNLATLLSVLEGVPLDFNRPFRLIYNSLDVVEFQQAPPVQPPSLSVSPASLDFGTIEAGESATQNYEICNEGGMPLTGTSTLTLPAGVSDAIPFNLAPNECTDIPVTITAGSQPGLMSGQIAVVSNAGSVTLPVTFTVVVLDPPQLSVSPTSIDLGMIPIGGSVNGSYTITNRGGGTLTGTSAFENGSSPSSFSLAAGQSRTETRTITAGNQTGTFSTRVVISSNGGSATVTFNYTVFDPTPRLSVSPTTINLGMIPVGESRSGSYTITNVGGGTLTGASNCPCETMSLPFSLGAGQSLTETLTITVGSQTGASSTLVTITSNGGSETVTFNYTVVP